MENWKYVYRILPSPILPPSQCSPRCQIGLLAVREEHGLWVSQYRVLRGIFGMQREEVTGGQGKCIMGSFMVCSVC
jgi:hypothetical protein